MADEGWEARMAARARARAHARGEITFDRAPRGGFRPHPEWIAAERAWQMAEHPERFSPVPPDDPSVCLNCSTWMIENSDLGRYAWWLTCTRVPCPCCNCDEAVIIG